MSIPNTFDLSGKIALVTVSSRGIGEAISVALKDMGMKVAANYAGNDERARYLLPCVSRAKGTIVLPL